MLKTGTVGMTLAMAGIAVFLLTDMPTYANFVLL
jgi:hypothetical protein